MWDAIMNLKMIFHLFPLRYGKQNYTPFGIKFVTTINGRSPRITRNWELGSQYGNWMDR
jgi:hypothetical protein